MVTRPLILFASFVLLVGCAPNSVRELRNNYTTQSIFTVDQNYQQVYRTVLNQTRECHETGMITAQMVVKGDLYHDIKEGNVSVSLIGGFGVDTHLAIDIKALDDASSKVIVFNALQSWDKAGKAVKDWVLNNSTECT